MMLLGNVGPRSAERWSFDGSPKLKVTKVEVKCSALIAVVQTVWITDALGSLTSVTRGSQRNAFTLFPSWRRNRAFLSVKKVATEMVRLGQYMEEQTKGSIHHLRGRHIAKGDPGCSPKGGGVRTATDRSITCRKDTSTRRRCNGEAFLRTGKVGMRSLSEPRADRDGSC